MRVAIVGSRTFTDFIRFNTEMAGLNLKPTQIVSGAARGADSLAREWAIQNAIPVLEIIPDWAQYGKAAGMIRNGTIIDNADVLVAFWDGKSPGTKNSIERAKRKNIPIHIISI